jgi:hypothetical protein
LTPFKLLTPHIRTLNFEGRLQDGFLSDQLYNTEAFDVDSILQGYRYSGQIKSLVVKGDARYVSLDFWIQTRSQRRIVVATIRPGYDETPLQGAIAAGLFIGNGSSFGVTCQDAIGNSTIEFIGSVEETGAITPSATGDAPPSWGQVAGDITLQLDLAQALRTKVSLAQVEELLDEVAEDTLGKDEADALYLPAEMPNLLELYNRLKL